MRSLISRRGYLYIGFHANIIHGYDIEGSTCCKSRNRLMSIAEGGGRLR